MWSDELSTQEARFSEAVLRELEQVVWAKPLIEAVSSSGISSGTMPLLFEARFALDIHRAGWKAVYEHKAGVGESSIDFRILSNPEWHVELVSIRESQGFKSAIMLTNDVYELQLQTDAENPDHSEEAEMIRAQMKIGEKVLCAGAPTKFPIPNGAIHVVLADMRGYLGNGGDCWDYLQIAVGAQKFPPSEQWKIHYWEGSPIRGLFEQTEPQHPLRASSTARQRLHFLGFVAEQDYRFGEMREKACYLPNPDLVTESHGELLAKCCPLTVSATSG